MPLVNLTTNLKSLKYGQDRPDGGSSGQPYIQDPIEVDIDFDSLGVNEGISSALEYISGNDFLLRGGPLGATLSTANDVARLTKYFTDIKTPNGLLFAAKQNLLSSTAVRTQTSGLFNEGIYTPLSTLAQAGVSAFGLHLNKQGLNPFAQTGVNATNNDNLYAVKVGKQRFDIASNPITDNRLIKLYGVKFLTRSDTEPQDIFLGSSVSDDPFTLLYYRGGPGSILGVGATRIRLYNPTERYNLDIDPFDPFKNYLTLGYRQLNSAAIPTIDSIQASDPSGIPNTTSQTFAFSTSTLELNNPRAVKSYIPALTQTDFRKTLIDALKFGKGSPFATPVDKDGNPISDAPPLISTIISAAPPYDYGANKTIENRIFMGDPGNANGKNIISYTSGSNFEKYKGAASFNSYDSLTAIPIYYNDAPDDKASDLVKFRIGVIDNDDPNFKTYIHFRAFLDQISDQYISDWDPTQYIGRGEKFYTYRGFDRKVSLSWTVAAQSKAELIPMYKKLNYLASVCAPNYSKYGFMRANIVTLTIGGYFYEQPGIITGFSYEMNEENATWEIGIDDNGESDSSVKELPHLIKVTGFNFIPIHKFVPSLQQVTFDPGGELLEDLNIYNQEKYIALSAGGKDNYKSPKIVLYPVPDPLDNIFD